MDDVRSIGSGERIERPAAGVKLSALRRLQVFAPERANRGRNLCRSYGVYRRSFVNRKKEPGCATLQSAQGDRARST